VVWGLAGLLGLLAYAVMRLTQVVLVGLEDAWGWHHVAVAAGNALFMAWSEGIRGFQQGFSPRVAARLRWLLDNPAPRRVVLAPMFAMGYFDAPRRRMLGVYGLTAGIAVLIVVVHMLPQPWRAVLDIGVVIGLCWGIVTVVAFSWRAFSDDSFAVAPEVPGR